MVDAFESGSLLLFSMQLPVIGELTIVFLLAVLTSLGLFLWRRVVNLLAAKDRQIQDYLQQVEQVIEAAVAVESDAFRTDQLQDMAERSDSLGQLARVFNQMVETIATRAKDAAVARDHLQAVLNAVPGSISWVSSEGIYLGVNQHLARKFQLSPDIMIGRALGSFNPSPDYKNFMDQFLQSDRDSACEEVLIQGNDRAFHYIMAAQKYQQGKATVVVGIDVTERHEAEEALRIAEENYRSIFENALDGIFQSSPDGHFLKVNTAMARIYGYNSPAEMLASITDIANQIYVDSQARTEFQTRISQCGEVKNLQYQVYRKDGKIIWVEENTRAVRDSQGNLLYFAGVVQDITQRKQREVELERQLAELQIEIDHQKCQKEVDRIRQTDYFQELQTEVRNLDLESFWG